MKQGYSVSTTGEGTDREMMTFRLQDGTFVAAICYAAKGSQESKSSGFWVQYVRGRNTTPQQFKAIKGLILKEVQKKLARTFGDP